MNAPLVTIVTPSFNQGRFIRATIESVLAQSYPAIEYIVMDGGSTDETVAVVSEYSSRLKFFSEPDRGQSHAINKGFQMARGEIVAWLNSDDILLEPATERAVAAFAGDSLAGAVYGEGFVMDEAGNLKSRFPYTQPFDLWRLAHLSDYILQQSTYFRRDAVAAVGWLREDLHYTMDWDLLIRIGKRWPLRRIPAYMGCIRDYGATKTALGGERRVAEIREMLRSHTGQRVPPGWLLYGLETYADVWCRRINRATPLPLRVLGEGLQMLIYGVCSKILSVVINDTGGWYADGGVGEKMEYWLPHGNGEVVLEGEMPGSPWLQEQVARVFSGGTLVGEYPIGFGPFRIAAQLPAPPEGEPVRLRLVNSRTVAPSYSWQEEKLDLRELAFRLDRIWWQGHEYLPPGQDPDFPNEIAGKAR
jgi:GT2 family glycosyltransferase